MTEILEYAKEFCRFIGLLVVMAGMFAVMALIVEVMG